jgi:hypothetical protein
MDGKLFAIRDDRSKGDIARVFILGHRPFRRYERGSVFAAGRSEDAPAPHLY